MCFNVSLYKNNIAYTCVCVCVFMCVCVLYNGDDQ